MQGLFSEATRNTAICSSSIFSWVGPGELVYLGRKQYCHLFPKTNKPRRTELIVHLNYTSDQGVLQNNYNCHGEKGFGANFVLRILCDIY